MDELKNIWNWGVEKNVSYYTEREINEFVVGAAHKSLRRVYPSVSLMILFGIAILLLIYSVFFGYSTDTMRYINMGVLLFLTVCFILLVRSYRITHRYHNDLPIKIWLENRIKMMQRSLEMNIKYNFLITASAFFVSFSYYYFFIQQLSFPISIWIIIAVTVGNGLFIVKLRNSVIRNSRIALEELKKIYNQLEEH